MKIIFRLLVLLILLLLLSCGAMSLDPASQPGNLLEGGGIRLHIDTQATRTLLPPISMDIFTYDITGVGPNGATFSELNVTDNLVTISNIAFGQWQITVNAKNEEGTIIATGQGGTTVHTGETAEIDIVISPLVGTGALNIDVNWQAEDVDISTVWSELISTEGNARSLDFSLEPGSASYNSAYEIDTGYHTLIVKLLDNGLLTIGAVEVVRIVKEQTTTGTFNFFDINQPGGQIQVNISAKMEEPIDITLTGGQATLAPGASMTLAATVPEEVGAVTYVWYINGESQDVGNSFIVADLPKGSYNLNVTAFSVDGKRAGSTGYFLRVTDFVNDYNPLGVRQIAATSSSYALAWNPWPGADGYNVYEYNASGDILLETVTDTRFQENGLSRKGVTPLTNAQIKILPVSEGIEANIDQFYYQPILYNQSEVINTNLYDSFDDGTINSSYIFANETSNDITQIYERNGQLEFLGAVTDNSPDLYVICDLANHNSVTFKARLYIHRVNDYHNAGFTVGYDVMYQPEETRNYFRVYMSHEDYMSNYGLNYFRFHTNGSFQMDTLSNSEYYDEWFDLGITIDKANNRITIIYGNETYITEPGDAFTLKNIYFIRLLNYGWWTGHYMYIDDLSIEFN